MLYDDNVILVNGINDKILNISIMNLNNTSLITNNSNNKILLFKVTDDKICDYSNKVDFWQRKIMMTK